LIGVGELGAEEEDLGRVVDPGQDEDHPARGPVGRAELAAAEVHADHHLADEEETRGHRGPHPDVSPLDLHVG